MIRSLCAKTLEQTILEKLEHSSNEYVEIRPTALNYFITNQVFIVQNYLSAHTELANFGFEQIKVEIFIETVWTHKETPRIKIISVPDIREFLVIYQVVSLISRYDEFWTDKTSEQVCALWNEVSKILSGD